ncbi:MAG: cobalamin biosynthesis protein, partial [Gordonia sp. (in: high G+C Gram-positive bacteria)]
MRMKRAEAAGMALGAVADGVFADPRRGHPVAGFGTAVSRVEQAVYADDRRVGAVFAAGAIAAAAAAGAAMRRA